MVCATNGFGKSIQAILFPGTHYDYCKVDLLSPEAQWHVKHNQQTYCTVRWSSRSRDAACKALPGKGKEQNGKYEFGMLTGKGKGANDEIDCEGTQARAMELVADATQQLKRPSLNTQC